MRTLLIDDTKTHIKADRIARTFDDGIKALIEEGPWDILYLDYDLSDNESPARTGYTILERLEGMPKFIPAQIIPISASSSYNSVLREKIGVLKGNPYF